MYLIYTFTIFFTLSLYSLLHIHIYIYIFSLFTLSLSLIHLHSLFTLSYLNITTALIFLPSHHIWICTLFFCICMVHGAGRTTHALPHHRGRPYRNAAGRTATRAPHYNAGTGPHWGRPTTAIAASLASASRRRPGK